MNLNNENIELTCSHCGFTNSATVRDVREERVILCLGCGCGMQLRDHERSTVTTERKLNDALDQVRREFQNEFKRK
jgi:ribosomal protein L37E